MWYNAKFVCCLKSSKWISLNYILICPPIYRCICKLTNQWSSETLAVKVKKITFLRNTSLIDYNCEQNSSYNNLLAFLKEVKLKPQDNIYYLAKFYIICTYRGRYTICEILLYPSINLRFDVSLSQRYELFGKKYDAWQLFIILLAISVWGIT